MIRVVLPLGGGQRQRVLVLDEPLLHRSGARTAPLVPHGVDGRVDGRLGCHGLDAAPQVHQRALDAAVHHVPRPHLAAPAVLQAVEALRPLGCVVPPAAPGAVVVEPVGPGTLAELAVPGLGPGVLVLEPLQRNPLP